MKKIRSLRLLGVLILSACAYHSVEPDNSPNLRELSGSEESVSGIGNDFAFTLLRNVQSNPDENVFISPLSVGMALGMSLNGAEGATRDGILQAIHFEGLTPQEVNQAYNDLTSLLTSMDRKVELHFANSIWYRDNLTVNPEFASIVDQSYNGKAQGLDFSNPASRQTINDWVDGKTNHRIQNLLESISPNEVMFLINAIYFKGNWAYRFDKSQTRRADFFKEDGNAVDAQMMHAKEVKLSYVDQGNFTLLDIPYGNGQFNMTIIEPKSPLTVARIVNEINNDSLQSWLESAHPATLILEMPKFRINWKKTLNESLTNMGMGVAFSDNANFPGLFLDKISLKITRVVHQSFVEVDEDGTEAAAATAVGIGVTSGGPPTLIRIDRPFLFLIREKHSGVILFIGQLKDPS